MRNKNGFSTIVVCVIVLILCMILAILIEYAAIYNCAENEKAEAQLKLDSLVTSYAVDKYNALKQGKAYSQYLNQSELIAKAYEALDFGSASIRERVISKGSLTYTIQRPEIRYLSDGQFGVKASFDVIVPFTVFGKTVGEVIIPIAIISKYI